MKHAVLALLSTLAVIALISAGVAGDAEYGDYRITGPYTHDNLSVFFIHGKDQVDNENLLTLTESLKQKKVIVYETGDVGELAIENVSDEIVFIQGGDIVKGGKQDRVIPVDFVIYPASGRLPLRSFCVEQGRWSQRGSETVHEFESSDKQVASKELKIAMKAEQSQAAVWNEVDNLQVRAGRVAEVSVRGPSSETSLQLTLENRAIEALAKPYIDAVSSEVHQAERVVGFAFVINGEINSADIYRSQTLFKKVSPKLIEACAIEAVTQLCEDSVSLQLTADDIAMWLDKAARGDARSQKVNDYTTLKTTESESDIVFETFSVADSSLIHLNVLKK